MKRRVALVALALACLALPASAAAAVHIRGVDTSGYPRVRVTVVTAKPTTRAPAVTEGGQPVTVTSAENLGHNASVALLIDRSRSMKGKSLTNAITAARQFIGQKPAGDAITVIGFGSTAVQLTGFSTDPTDADTQLRTMVVDSVQGTALYDAITLASNALATRSGAHLILLVTDGKDVSSSATQASAIDAAHHANATVYPIGIQSFQFTPDALEQIATDTGGIYRGSSSAGLVDIYRTIADELGRTWRIEYLTASRPGESFSVGVSSPGEGTVRQAVKLPGQPGTISGPKTALPTGAFSGTGTAVLAIVVGLLLMIAIRLVFKKSRSDEMRRRIQPHIGVEAKVKVDKAKRDKLGLMRGLFRSTESVLGKSRPWSALTRLLERGDVPLKTVEFAYIILASGLLVGFLLSVFGLHGMMLFVGFLIGAMLPVGYVWRKAKKRLNAFDEQLPDLLMSTAASLKAGHSFKQAIQTIVDEAEDPAQKEFQRVIAETSLGRPIEQALSDMAERLGSKNFSFIVTAVTIQNQVGGSLAGLFDMVADTVRQRQSFARKIKALTAMGRASAYVLIALPIFLAMLLTMINHKYMAPLFTTSSGHKLIIVGLVMMAIGSTILRKIVSFNG